MSLLRKTLDTANVLRDAVDMVRDYLLYTRFLDYDSDSLAKELDISPFLADRFCTPDACFTVHQLLEVLRASNIDIALTLRTPDGTETTFYPTNNLGGYLNTLTTLGSDREIVVLKDLQEASR